MKRTWMAILAAATALATMSVVATGASAATFDCSVPLDDFNRANAADLGPNWSAQAAEIKIESNSATNPAATSGLATWNGAVPTQQACVDVSTNGNGLQYAGLVLGYGNVTSNAFLKVQVGAGGGFDRAFIYYGNNNSECKIAGGCFFPLSEFNAARLHGSLNPLTGEVVFDIDTNFDNVPDQSIARTYELPLAFGSVIGINAFGHSFLDNFATAPAPVTPPVVTPTPTPTVTPTPPKKVTKKPLKCKKGFRKKKVKGKFRCVKKVNKGKKKGQKK